MTCPVCAATVDVGTPIAGLVICGTCLSSLVVADGTRATAAQTRDLSVDQLAALRTRRADARKARPL